MPYYQYKEGVEIRFYGAQSRNQFEIEKIEREEEGRFNSVLSRERNRIIDLLDLFFPPRYYFMNERLELYPTLPVQYRAACLEALSHVMKDDFFGLNLPSVIVHSQFSKLLEKQFQNSGSFYGSPVIYSYAVYKYDNNRFAIVNEEDILSCLVETKKFIGLLIEQNIFPLELLHYKTPREYYLSWGREKLKKLLLGLKKEEAWPLTICVSLLSGFYVPLGFPFDGSSQSDFRLNFDYRMVPLRSKKEVVDNTIESYDFRRVNGVVDERKPSKEMFDFQEKWNSALRRIYDAMKFDEIKHNGKDNKVTPETKLYVADLSSWVERNKHHFVSDFIDAFLRGDYGCSGDRKNDDQLLTRKAIKANYSGGSNRLSDMKWDRLFEKEKENGLFDACRCADENGKAMYNQEALHRWLIKFAYFTQKELNRNLGLGQLPSSSIVSIVS